MNYTELDEFNELYNYINHNMSNILDDDNIRSMLDPKTNKLTKELLQDYDQLEAYSISFFITVLAYISFLHYIL
jgi:hypothetical protein